MDVPNEKLIAGTYSRSMWSYDVSWLDDVIVDPPDDSGIDDLSLNNKLTFYPNPVEDIVYFDSVKENEIKIYATNGQLVTTESILHLNGYSKLNLGHLSPGLYYYVLGQNRGSILKK
jgi:hypothetical protein